MSKKKRSIFSHLVRSIILLGLWCGIGVTLLFAWYALELPSITRNANFERKASITVKAADGEVIGRYGDIKGENVTAEDLPPELVYAVLAIEDRRFYSHWGIDFYGIARAIGTNLLRGRFVQGGSTITQQLAKNLFLSQERTLKRKIQEAMLALWLEHELTKDEILSAYLNRVYMGSGTYGVDAASKLYFKKEVKDLTLKECATLAGLLKAPSRYSPLSNPELSRQRTETVLKAMTDAGYISGAQANVLSFGPPIPPPKPGPGDSERYYADWVVDSLQDLIGTPDEDIIVETTMDRSLQKVAAESLSKVILESGQEKHISQGAVVSMLPDGKVVALVGGYDYKSNQFNRATQALRQPGSSFKPIVYLAALESGFKPDDVLVDAPFTQGRYRPKNFGNKYYGEVSLETALMLSLNTISVQLVKAIGPAKVIEVARRLGITSPLNNDLSQALGTNTLPPLEMAGAYAAIANGGIAIHPYGIVKIESEDGKLYYQRQAPRDTMRVVSSDNIDTLVGMMQNVIEYGTGQGAKLPWPAYGKTGTSQDSRDAWFIGFTPEIVTAVWLGNDDNTSMKAVTGGSFPAHIWRDVMMAAHGRFPDGRFPPDSPATFESLMDRLSGPPPEQEKEEIFFNTPQRPKPKDFPGDSSRYND